ncbi:hypothetical protein GH714_008304 [Hevea brasiliensis]|uniref:Ubiquitin-like protease family profile domain-containing protein n=1 Tax=Hevea brasiliensis TaxID=3981 RepID=A0A6A6KYV5_HEVBR|nr:hypothetical protein GH714_008304 [Hevea brasiliensis]
MTRPPPSLGVSSTKRSSVFDFSEDDERVEKASEKFLGKFAKHKGKRDFTSPIIKYKFLECFAGCTGAQEKESAVQHIVVDNESIDVDMGFAVYPSAQEKESANETIIIDNELAVYPSAQEKESANETIIIDNEPIDVEMIFAEGIKAPCKEISDESVDIDANGVSDFHKLSVSPPICTLQEDCTVKEACCVDAMVQSGSQIYENKSVDMISDDDDGSETSTASISISTLEQTEVPSKDPVPESSSVGHKIVETAMINLYFKPKVSKGAGNANETSAIDKLKFSVYDPCWFQGQKAIKSLDVRYRSIWNVIFDLDEPFEDVIYPKGDPDAVSISKRDVELLRPGTFINDTIVDFYIKFLKNKIQPKDQHRFHFFNSFFFRKLADLDKDPRNACEGRAAFQRVRKWTRKVNLFEKDYIFIPVNYSLHWSLIVICHPGEVANFRDDECGRALKVPCILHMDSIRGSHRGLKNLIQSYLCEEWKERHGDTLDDVSSKFSRLQFVPLELPQQENSFDCGLFLLHYVELFLEEVPINFSPFKITEFSNFLNRNWFLPEEASLKRAHIWKLICEILEDQSQQIPKGESIDKYPCSLFANTNEQETGIEFLTGESGSLKMCQSDLCSLNTEMGIEISLPSASPLRVVPQQIREPGLDSRELFEPETSARLFYSRNYSRACRLSFMSPVEEAEEIGEQISDSSSDTEGFGNRTICRLRNLMMTTQVLEHIGMIPRNHQK